MTSEQERILRALAARLILRVSEVAVRGSGTSLFLYVIGSGRSAEVSWDGERLWVEFWNSLEEDARAASDATFDTVDEAEAALLDHLT